MRYEQRDLGGWGYIAHRPDGGYYATNGRHQGLFLVRQGDVKQLEGTAQFRPASFQAFKRRIQEMVRS